ncbi:MAG: hypothetical protein C0432_01100 [Candidatus Puniceispirillum sp.]|nr:hypothetical protein [Candidatus Pelagibacter sp.]MBA4282879.1 hypothetical protein [Candidatus Puniceispirillum sp.]
MVKKLFIFLILLFSFSIIALQTSFVQVPLLNFLINKAIHNPNLITSYGKIHGFFPVSFTIENFNLKDNTQKILDLKNLKISLNSKKESFYIRSINCQKFTVYKNIDQIFKNVKFTAPSLPLNSQNIFPWTGNIAYSSLSPQTDLLIIQKIYSKKNNDDQNPFIVKIHRTLPENKLAKYQIDIHDSGILISDTPLKIQCSFTKDSKGMFVFSQSTVTSKSFSLGFQGNYMSQGQFFNIDFISALDLDYFKKVTSSGSLKRLKKSDHLHLDLKTRYESFGKDRKIIQTTNIDINTHFSIDIENRQASLFSIHVQSPIPFDIKSEEGILISQKKVEGKLNVSGLGAPLHFTLKGNYEKALQLLNLSLTSDFQSEVLLNLQSKIDLIKQNMNGHLQFQTKTIPRTSLNFKISQGANNKFSININSKEIQFFSSRLLNVQSILNFNQNDTFDLNINTKINNVTSNPILCDISGGFDSKDISIKTFQLSYLNQIVKNIHSFKVSDITSSPQLNDLKLACNYNGQDTGQIEWNLKKKKILFKTLSLLNLKTIVQELPFSAEIDGFIDLSSEPNLQDYTRIIEKSSITIHNFVALNGILQSYKSVFLNKKITFNITQDLHYFKLQLLGYDHLKKITLASGTIGKIVASEFATAPINIHIKGDADINPVVSFLKFPDTIEGTILYDLKYTGTISKPNLNGTLKVKNGLYESFINGTYLAHLNGDIKVKDNILTIKDISGDDVRQGSPSNGHIHITGKSTIHSYNLIENHLVLKLTNLMVVKRDDMEMKATGSIKLDGENERTKITGSVALDPAIIWLEELTNDDITSISLFENGKRVFVTSEEINSKRVKNKNQNSQVLFPIDLELRIPQSLQLSGLGMTSTWKGALHVKGDFFIDVPYLAGTLELTKGSILFYGKKLKLANGSIIFDQKSINNPYLNLAMMRQIAGQKLFINMLGRTTSGEKDSLRFTFSADPSETDKNVLSLIIFGKRTNQITAGQSIHLASIATSISNKSNENSSFMDKLKNNIGLDVFEFKENAREAQYSDTGYTQKQVLSVGKDFNDFKVTFNQGIGDMDTKATISKPIGPHLNLDIDVGNQVAGSGGGLSWIYYY